MFSFSVYSVSSVVNTRICRHRFCVSFGAASFANAREASSIFSGAGALLRMRTRYMNVLDWPGSSVRLNSLLPAPNSLSPSGLAANRP